MASNMSKAVSSSHAIETEKVLLNRSTQAPRLRQDLKYGFEGCDDDSASSFHSRSSSHLLSSKRPRGNMMTQTSLLTLPRKNSSCDLANFLRTTGPESSTKTQRPSSRSTFRFFTRGNKRARNDVAYAHNELNDVLFDEGGLLLPDVVEQKVSSAGKRYLALRVKEQDEPFSEKQLLMQQDTKPSQPKDKTSTFGSSHISDFSTLVDDLPTIECYDKWCNDLAGGRTSPVSPISDHKTSMDFDLPRAPSPKLAYRTPLTYGETPDFKPQIEPPPPQYTQTALAEPAELYRSGLAQHPAEEIFDSATDIDNAKYQMPRIRKPVTPMPRLTMPEEEFPVRVPKADKACDIKHPSPRRFASHPVLKRTSSLAEDTQTRSEIDTPATPPPKSPLRLRRENRLVERPLDTICQLPLNEAVTATVISTASNKVNMAIPYAEDLSGVSRINATVTTQCTGPLTRQLSDGYTQPTASRKEREERIRARKLRDRPPSIARALDAMVSLSTTSPQRRLRKARPRAIHPITRDAREAPWAASTLPYSRTSSQTKLSEHSTTQGSPQLTTPDLKPAPLHTRSASSVATPSNRSSELTASTPISPARTIDSTGMSPRPMMLVAEEVSLPKAKSPFKPAKIVVAKERVYTPRPRSASMPKTTPLRRSCNSITLPSRVLTPEMPKDDSKTPPLPSPPPNRALPPTPPASGSERFGKRFCRIPTPQKSLVSSASAQHESVPVPPVSSRQYTPQTRKVSSWDDTQLRARLEALENRNKFLEDAVLALLSANGPTGNSMAAFLKANMAMGLDGAVNRHVAAEDAAGDTAAGAIDIREGSARAIRANSG